MPGTADWRRPSDAQLTVFADRLEVHSPRALPNGVTVEKAKDGLRVPRNSNIVNVLRDYDFMEHRGMGIRRKVIPLTRAHNGTDPRIRRHRRLLQGHSPQGRPRRRPARLGARSAMMAPPVDPALPDEPL